MTPESVPPATRLRPRLLGPPSSAGTRAALTLTAQAAAGLAAVSGDDPAREPAGLAAAVAVVVAAAEHTDRPVLTVSGPDGPVPVAVAPAAHDTVADLVRAVDAALRAAPAATGPQDPGTVRVRSALLDPGPDAGSPATVGVTVTAPGPDGGRELVVEAGPDLAGAWFPELLVRSVAAVLGGFADPRAAVAGLPVAPPEDVATATEFGTRGFRPEAGGTTLTAPIAAASDEYPDRTAVVAGAATLTHRELWRAAEAVAARLRASGVGRGDRVALLTGKSVHAVSAIVGTLRAGAAYVPLDPRSPAARLAEILDDADCAAVLAAPDLTGLLPTGTTAIDIGSAACSGEAAPELPGPTPRDLAYVLYTSGSTGRPKGVQISHGAAASYVRWKIGHHGIGPDTRVLQLPSLAFDSSVADVFPVLAAGGRLVLADAHQLRPRQVAGMVADHGITHLMSVPSLYRVLLDELPGAAGTLRVVTVAGEATTADLVSRHHDRLAGVRLVNEYGPTENSVGATAFDHDVDAGPGVPIGRPVDNTVVVVTDAAGRALPAGFVGEIRLAGHGLAEGYRNDPEQTAGVFVADPSVPGGRSYRTGDLGWWRPDGLLEFAGRADQQVKIRGHRVEPGEVESVLAALPGVRQAVVTVVSGPDGAPALAAWLEADGSGVEEIRSRAAAGLPPAMIPAVVTLVEEMPRLVSGKIDREALTRPVEAAPPAPEPDPEPTASDDDGVAAVAGIFAEILGSGPLGPDSDFFDEGGHSLLAISLLDTIEERLGVSVDLDDFFDRPTVRDVADLVRRAEPVSGR